MDDHRHSADELQQFFEALKRGLEERRIAVHLHGRLSGDEMNLNGSFVPRTGPTRWIGDVRIYRAYGEVAGDPMDELLTLAHEGGHAISYMRKLSTDEYRGVADRVPHEGTTLTGEQKRLVIEEEARAWVLGRSELGSVGFADWPAFEAEVKRALGIYGDMLDVEVAVDTLLAEQDQLCVRSSVGPTRC